MEADSVLNELWAVKELLAREAGYDADRFIQNLRRWETDHPANISTIRNATDIQKFMAEAAQKQSVSSALILNDLPPAE